MKLLCGKNKKFEKIVCMALVACMVLTVMLSGSCVNIANAEKFSTTPSSQDDKFTVSYDSKKYTIYWISRKKITLESQYRSMWSDLDKGDKLGTATIRAYYLEPKSKTGDNYYAIAGCQVSMDPVDIDGDVTGMSQLASFKIKTTNEDSRVCSPSAESLNIQASKGTSKSGSFTAGTGLAYNASEKAWKASADFNYTKSWGSSSTYTYNMTNVVLIQKNNNGEYASWSYDYVSKNKDKVWNAHLMSSSKVAGQVVYRLDGKPTSSNRAKNIPTKLVYDIRFGAGNSSNGKVANRMGPYTNREMSIMKGTMNLSY